jgi:hypothetical protein
MTQVGARGFVTPVRIAGACRSSSFSGSGRVPATCGGCAAVPWIDVAMGAFSAQIHLPAHEQRGTLGKLAPSGRSPCPN